MLSVYPPFGFSQELYIILSEKGSVKTVFAGKACKNCHQWRSQGNMVEQWRHWGVRYFALLPSDIAFHFYIIWQADTFLLVDLYCVNWVILSYFVEYTELDFLQMLILMKIYWSLYEDNILSSQWINIRSWHHQFLKWMCIIKNYENS